MIAAFVMACCCNGQVFQITSGPVFHVTAREKVKIKAEVAEVPVIVVPAANFVCPHCDRLKAYLTSIGQPFRVEVGPGDNFPRFCYKSRVVVGFDQQRINELLGVAIAPPPPKPPGSPPKAPCKCGIVGGCPAGCRCGCKAESKAIGDQFEVIPMARSASVGVCTSCGTSRTKSRGFFRRR